LVGGVAAGFYAAVELSDAERDELLQLGRKRLDAFRIQRAEKVFWSSPGLMDRSLSRLLTPQ
jgi:hypothetical protein